MSHLRDLPLLGEFLSKELVATLALAVDKEGTIHIASLGYWHAGNPLKFYFVTSKDTEKCILLLDGSVQKSACVVGTVKGVNFTLQMRGMTQIVDKDTHKNITDAFTKKRGNNSGVDKPETVLLEFTPTWARYVDYSKSWQPEFLDLA